MSGTQITIKDEKAQALLAGIEARSNDLSPLMKRIAALVLASVQRNFEVGGRPQWAALKPSTLKKRHSSGGPLVVKGFGGGLLGSVHAESDSTTATVGTDKIYAAVHQLGAAKGSFGQALAGDFRRTGFMRGVERGVGYDWSTYRPIPWGDIPARPFLMLQPADLDGIREESAKFVLGASGGTL